MPTEYLHNHKQFADLLRIIEDETGIQAGLIEKDYWIMHTLYGLQKQGYDTTELHCELAARICVGEVHL